MARGTDATRIERGWVPYRRAAREYLGISEDILLAAINRGELDAFEKPLTKGRKPGASRENHSYFVALSDVDTYIRTYWHKVSVPAAV